MIPKASTRQFSGRCRVVHRRGGYRMVDGNLKRSQQQG